MYVEVVYPSFLNKSRYRFSLQLMLADMNKELKGLRCAVSGSGKIAMHVLENMLMGPFPSPCLSATYLIPLNISGLELHLGLRQSVINANDSVGSTMMKLSLGAKGDVCIPLAYRAEINQADAINLAHVYAADAVGRFERLMSQEFVLLPTAGVGGKAKDETASWYQGRERFIPIDKVSAIHAGCCRELQTEGTNLNWSPEDLSLNYKFNINLDAELDFFFSFELPGRGRRLGCKHDKTCQFEAMKQTYQRALKAATDFGYQKESPEALVHGAVISAFLTIANGMVDQGCV
ncbi:hypothetical protein HAX54_003937 [Datura stramonium]|uniref:Uncharacterized protein n=1 Tax=Datura stramonium TaxID=4076 RepID=A0ABS8RTP8_DATST|nr:hypothetical protein [Datura stramonium]